MSRQSPRDSRRSVSPQKSTPSTDSHLQQMFVMSTTKITLLLCGVVVLHQANTIAHSNSPSGAPLMVMVVALLVGRGQESSQKVRKNEAFEPKFLHPPLPRACQLSSYSVQ